MAISETNHLLYDTTRHNMGIINVQRNADGQPA